MAGTARWLPVLFASGCDLPTCSPVRDWCGPDRAELAAALAAEEAASTIGTCGRVMRRVPPCGSVAGPFGLRR
ncbi:MAG: hypothetical protein ACLPVY_07740 [Acidimicrobiia bacterium]